MLTAHMSTDGCEALSALRENIIVGLNICNTNCITWTFWNGEAPPCMASPPSSPTTPHSRTSTSLYLAWIWMSDCCVWRCLLLIVVVCCYVCWLSCVTVCVLLFVVYCLLYVVWCLVFGVCCLVFVVCALLLLFLYCCLMLVVVACCCCCVVYCLLFAVCCLFVVAVRLIFIAV